MHLKELLQYDPIVIQCHDAPDADTIASGFALYQYFLAQGHHVSLCYGGKFPLSKPNIAWMIKHLHIPICFSEYCPDCELLVTVDCQYGSGNVTKWNAPNVAVIDHHRRCVSADQKLFEIRSTYGSCSTVVWAMLQDAGFDANSNVDVATALYYGLYMDTAHFAEIRHPVDKDMRDSLKFREMDFFRLININMTTDELDIFVDAIEHYEYDEHFHTALVPVQPCDPNVLGIISDFIIQVDKIEVCVVFCKTETGCKFSVRSCTIEVHANELADHLCRTIGSGGGHATKSGGFLSQYLYQAQEGKRPYADYLKREIKVYYGLYRTIRAKEFQVSLEKMKYYVKRKTNLGVVKVSDFLRDGIPILVRTLEGDLECVSEPDLYVMIGIDGEVYPIREEKFQRTYRYCEGKPDYHSDYEPTIHNTLTGEIYPLSSHMRTCCARGTSYIYARPVSGRLKVFTQWDEYKYLSGEPGDYLAVRSDDHQDVYIIRRNIFLRCYTEAEAKTEE